MARKGGGERRLDRIDLRRLLPLVGATLLIAGGLFCAWQTWLIADESDAAERTRSAQRDAVRVLGDAFRVHLDRLHKAVNDPALLAILDDHPAAASRLRQALPDARAVDVYSGGLDEVVHADYRQFGYAKAAQLMAALGAGQVSPASTAVEGGERRLTLVEPIGAPGDVRAWVWVEYAFDEWRDRFESVSPAGGRLELHQSASGDSAPLLARGKRSAEREASGLPVPGTAFYVFAALPKAFIVLPHSALLGGLLALIGLGGGGFLAWRRMTMPPPVESEGEGDDILVADVVRKPRLPPAPAPAPALEAPAAAATHEVDASIFRAYDVRGVVGAALNADTARLIGRAIGGVMNEHGLREMAVGRDGRLSGAELAGALSDGLRAAGIDVIDIGAVPTPMAYFAAFHLGTGCAVSVTGSHNPADHNGFKIVIGGETLSGDAIADLHRRIVERRLPEGGQGTWREQSVTEAYVGRVVGDIAEADRRLKVVVDAGNGIAGPVGPRVLEEIGCDVVPLHCEVDGRFPNHPPDPSDSRHLADLIAAVRAVGADIGIAFDGDGDRIGVVGPDGEVVPSDRLLMVFARDVLARNPGATIVYDVKCSAHLRRVVQEAAGVPLMWRTGHSMVKAKMRETGAALGGEMSGHFFFADGNRWYGFDDGIYAAVRLVEILAGDPEERSVGELFDDLPRSVSTPELRLAVENGMAFRFMESFRDKADFGDGRVTTLDGVRVEWPDGWGLVRASNTESALVFRFEADTPKALERVKDAFRERIHAVNDAISLPF
ncbi:phosphomannomutase/phosphoglucomutase [Luteibacter aegosomatis]|uniref:phosphomannomutase/phosphoglucomutase n=1 Tax=Luteibacter aegosomatis TaxID=2911537 RepID=UPI001FFBF86D|nr:phosphomannomutase/phosphoglucomutase [Luteibacter aegosomatis]UPG85569.1 phosphomannomutase/phosphoglucomutase [Luteibacter aegosomatis]